MKPSGEQRSWSIAWVAHAQAMVIAFDESAETVMPLSSDGPAIKRAIDSIQQTDKKSKLKLAYQLAEAQSAFNPEQLRPGVGSLPDVWVYSDGRVSDAGDLSIRGNLKYDKIGSDDAGNIAIVAMNAKRNYERPTRSAGFCALANYREGSRSTPMCNLRSTARCRPSPAPPCRPSAGTTSKRTQEKVAGQRQRRVHHRNDDRRRREGRADAQGGRACWPRMMRRASSFRRRRTWRCCW